VSEFLTLIASQWIRNVDSDWDTKVSRCDVLWWLRSTEIEDNSICYLRSLPFFAEMMTASVKPWLLSSLMISSLVLPSKITRSDYTFTRVEASVWGDFHWHISQ